MIYFIQCGNNGPIKIGQTDNDVEQRMAQLQIGCPYELRLLWVYTGDDFTEFQIHVELSHERIRGEWFHPSESVFCFIESEMSNYYEIKTNNDRSLEMVEFFNGKDAITFSTSMKFSSGNNKSTTIFHTFLNGNLGIDPADDDSDIDVRGYVVQ